MISWYLTWVVSFPTTHVRCYHLSFPRKPLLNSAKRSVPYFPRKQKVICALIPSSDGRDEDSFADEGQEYLRRLREITAAETALSNPLGAKLSHEIIRMDENKLGPLDRYVFVEERDCIGCTHCQTTAPGTFFLESLYGRARVFDQLGNTENIISEAIDTCPVNCIYYVDWEDLVELEKMCVDQQINNSARLVGGQDYSNSISNPIETRVMDSGLMRCEDCPGRGCARCPLYGVGNNPEYVKKKAERQALKQQKKEEDRKKSRRRF